MLRQLGTRADAIVIAISARRADGKVIFDGQYHLGDSYDVLRALDLCNGGRNGRVQVQAVVHFDSFHVPPCPLVSNPPT